MSDVSWSLELVDEMSPAAKKIAAEMGKLPPKLADVDAKLKKLNDNAKLEKLAKITDPLKKTEAMLRLQRDRLAENDRAARSTGVTLDSFGLGFAAKMATVHGAIQLAVAGTKMLVSYLAKGAIELVKLGIESSESKRAMLGALDVFEGDKQREVFGVLQDMGIAVGQSADKAVQAYADMRAAGFKAKEAQDILAASFDVAAQKGGGEGGAAAADKFRDLFVKFHSIEGVSKKALESLARDVGISPQAFAEALGKRIGKSADVAKELILSGKADAADASNALLDVVQSKFDKGGGLGTKAKEFADGSVVAQLQRVKDKFANLFEDSNLEPFTKLLKKVADTLDGPMGEKLTAIAEKTFAFIGELVDRFEEVRVGFSSVFDTQKMGEWWDKISGISEALGLGARTGDDWQRIGRLIGGAVMLVGGFVAILVEVGDLVSKLIDKFVMLNEKIFNGVGKFAKVGWESAKGFIGGLLSGSPEAADAASKLGDTSVDAMATTLEIHSPSRRFEYLGDMSVEGYRRPWEQSGIGVSVRASMADLLAYQPSTEYSTAPIYAGAAGASGAGQISVNVGDIIVHGASSPQETAREVSRTFREEALAFLQEHSYS